MVEHPDFRLLPSRLHLVEELTKLFTILSYQKFGLGLRESES